MATTSRLAQVIPSVTKRRIQAISYGGGDLSIRSFWWISRRIAWLRHPIMIPIGICFSDLERVTHI